MLKNNLFNLICAVYMIASVEVSFAAPEYLGDASLGDCTTSRSGRIEAQRADNGDINILLKDLNTSLCNKITFFDVSSKKAIDSHTVRGSSYTLSKRHLESLTGDCQIGIQLSGPYDTFETYTYNMSRWECQKANPPISKPPKKSAFSYQLSNKGNCKILKNGVYTEENISDKSFCDGASSKKDVVSYEYSNNNNCKRMINGQYSNKNVADRYCDARH